MDIHALQNVQIRPFESYGLNHEFWTLNLDTLLCTWIAMFGIGVFIYFARRSLDQEKSVFANILEKIVGLFANATAEAFGGINFDCSGFVSGLFFFTLACNLIGVLPFLKEATLDLSTTLAIASICFFYAQYQGIRVKGFSYFSKLFKPFVVFLPINFIGQVSKIISLNFRLFGNILAGGIIWGLLFQLLVLFRNWFYVASIVFFPAAILFKYFVPHEQRWSNFHAVAGVIIRLVQFAPGVLIYFGVVHGFIQALVISLLTSMYISNEVDKNSAH